LALCDGSLRAEQEGAHRADLVRGGWLASMVPTRLSGYISERHSAPAQLLVFVVWCTALLQRRSDKRGDGNKVPIA